MSQNQNRPALLAYARKSPCPETVGKKKDAVPSIERQTSLLTEAAARWPECDFIRCFAEVESARLVPWEERKELQALLKFINRGDHLVVWRLDRLANNPFDLFAILKILMAKDVRAYKLTMFARGWEANKRKCQKRLEKEAELKARAEAKRMAMQPIRQAKMDATALWLSQQRTRRELANGNGHASPTSSGPETSS
jgi:uncharacterized protein YjiS (DUF1127 family)